MNFIFAQCIYFGVVYNFELLITLVYISLVANHILFKHVKLKEYLQKYR